MEIERSCYRCAAYILQKVLDRKLLECSKRLNRKVEIFGTINVIASL